MFIEREKDQNPETISEIEIRIVAGERIAPIVTVENTILDGHHRNRAYQNLGQTAPALRLTQTQYNTLRDGGYDDMEIAGAAHFALDDGYGAQILDEQFPGANLYDRAADASELL